MSSEKLGSSVIHFEAFELTAEQQVVASEMIDAWLSYSLDIDVKSCQTVVKKSENAALLTLLGLIAVHQGMIEEGTQFIDDARKVAGSARLIGNLLMSGTYRTLANGCLLQKKKAEARKHFKSSLILLNALDAQNLGKNFVNSKCRLGLLEDGCLDLERRFVEALVGLDPDSDLHSAITVMHSELELLKHELLIAQQKSQLYKLVDEDQAQLDFSNTNSFKIALEKVSPSQLGQDLWVLEKHKFKRDGFFIEFGATDGILLSNTYVLEKYFGWAGLCAEPNPRFFEQLKVNRSCTVSEECIAATSGETVEFIFADEYGGMAAYADSDGHAAKRKAYQSINDKVSLSTISLADFLKKYEAPREIDYLSIDTEGSEYDILRDFPFDEWDIKCLSVEHNFTSAREKIFALLSGKGYTRIEAQFDDWYYKD
ncbi:FkbM family methyltransferase [Alteromonas aestuariivivens]|uniref:FkbM family methyltransferase n=1 Tax=Alteromonas aestuariivivens TaxID=1938339 RepID=A0A3D8M960_9ALTE|nr:FkbM family methyltransferase [Alteromonas aestuariivivens]RDV26573.1 FkbM family methyltransferase [Alteromonas aestuariivivens]